MLNIAWITVTGLIWTLEISQCQEVTKCVNEYELQFFKTSSKYGPALDVCKSRGGYTVQVHNEAIQDAIDEVIKGDHYYIGLKWNGDFFKWRNGEKPSDSGYNKWKTGEPNGWKSEPCVVSDRNGWSDYSCETRFYYICGKESEIKLSVEHLIVSQEGMYTVDCSVASGLAATSVSWENDETAFSTSGGKLELRISNISESGTYTCRGTAKCSKPKKLEVTVEGSPTILRVRPESCSSNLIVEWTVHRMARGFLHKVFVNRHFNEVGSSLLEIISYGYNATTITDLLPSTNYSVEIVACRGDDDCPENYYSTAWNVTGGISSTVSSANFTAVNDSTCALSWQEPETIGDAITIYEITLLEEFVTSRVVSTGNYYIHESNTTSFTFDLLPNRIYSASVQAISCAGKSLPVNATGGCYRQPEAPSNLIAPAELARVNGTRHLRFAVPSEENGTMSCLIVIVSDATNGSDCAETTKSNTHNIIDTQSILMTLGGDYIASLIPASKFTFKPQLDIILGDNKTTTCDLFVTTHDSTSSKNRTEGGDWPNGTLFGMNRILNDSLTYKVHIIAVVPYDGRVSITRSPYLYLYPTGYTDGNTGAEPQSHSVQIAIICTVTITALLLVNLTTIVINERKKHENCPTCGKVIYGNYKEEPVLPRGENSLHDDRPETTKERVVIHTSRK